MELKKAFYSATAAYKTEFSTYTKNVPAPLFRKSFSVSGKPESAELLVSGLGFYELYLNGERITKSLLAPYISDPDKVVYYDRYDLADRLREGENVVGVMLGNGMQSTPVTTWRFCEMPHRSAPKLALQFEMLCGKERTYFETKDMKCFGDSEIQFDDFHCGVFCDRTHEQKGWNAPGFDDGAWFSPFPCETPRGVLKTNEGDPVVIEKRIAPVSVREGELCGYTPRTDVSKALDGEPCIRPAPRSGGYLYDFGVNTAGLPLLKIKGHKGQKIVLQPGEILVDGKLWYENISFFPDGYVQTTTYVCGGDEEETFLPPFTYQGFRYIYVWGVTPEQATKDLLTLCVTHSDLRERGGFSCSDETANRLQACVRNSDLSNFHYFPTDCPHREKNGWTGDAAASCEHVLLNLEAERSYREWLFNIRKAQREDGALPGIVPNPGGWGFAWGNGPAWDRVLFDLPYFTYRYRGETVMIEENAHAMMSYLVYIAARRDKDGIVAVGLGDWVPVGRISAGHYMVPLGFTDSVMVMDMCRKGAQMFRAIGQDYNAAYCDRLYAEMRIAVRTRYVDLSSMWIEGSSMTGQAMAIYYDVLEPGEKPRAFENLMRLIRENRGHMAGGYLGLRVLFYVLTDFGEWDLAYDMITRRDGPSYGHCLELGATSMWESIQLDENLLSTGSFNHHFLGDISQFFLREVAGIRVNPRGNDVNEVTVHPHFIKKLTNAKAYHELPGGKVSVAWERDGDDVIVTIDRAEGVRCRAVFDNGLYIEDATEQRAYTDVYAAHTELRVKRGNPGGLPL